MDINNQQRFTTNASVVLDSNGNGSIRLAPAGEDWQVTSTAVVVSTKVKEAQAFTYSPYIGDPYVMDSTYLGSSGDTTDTTYYLNDGTPMFAVWKNGDAGATATVTVAGWKSVPVGRGFRAFS